MNDGNRPFLNTAVTCVQTAIYRIIIIIITREYGEIGLRTRIIMFSEIASKEK